MASSETPASTQTTADNTVNTPATSTDETEPLLGRPGDAIQKPDAPMIKNLWLGTGWIAQIGAVLLVAVVWSGVFTHPLLKLVSPHPLLQSLGVFTVVQAILILQPTTTGPAKLRGARAHASLQLLSFLLFLAGIALIETNKSVNHGEHLHSPHGYLGAVTGLLLAGQYAFGLLMWAVPGALGGVDRARATWKYHRYAGYLMLVLVLATVLSAVETDYNRAVLDIKMWAAAVAAALILVGVFPRVQLYKLGIHRG